MHTMPFHAPQKTTIPYMWDVVGMVICVLRTDATEKVAVIVDSGLHRFLRADGSLTQSGKLFLVSADAGLFLSQEKTRSDTF